MSYALLGINLLLFLWIHNTLHNIKTASQRKARELEAALDSLKSELQLLTKKETVFDGLEIGIGGRETLSITDWLQGKYTEKRKLECALYDTENEQKEADITSIQKWKATPDDAEAQYNIGIAYCFGWGVKQNDKTAFEWLRKSARNGWNDAKHILGMAYLNGYTVVEQDDKKAFEWWDDAGADYDGETQFLLGMAHANGIGTEKNISKAIFYLGMAADQRHPYASYQLGNWYYGASCSENFTKSKKKKVFDLWRVAAEGGIVEAQRNLGCAYYEGYGVQENYGRAIKWWEKAADGYDEHAENLLLEYCL